MADEKTSGGAKPASPALQAAAAAKDIEKIVEVVPAVAGSSPDRQFELIKHYGAALLGAKPGSTPTAIAKQVVDYADAVLAALDARNAKK